MVSYGINVHQLIATKDLGLMDKVETATFMYMFLSFPEFHRAGYGDFDEDQRKQLLDFFVQIEPFFDDLTHGLVDSRKKGIHVDLTGNVIGSPNNISSDQAESIHRSNFFLLAFWYYKAVQQIIETYDAASEKEARRGISTEKRSIDRSCLCYNQIMVT